jgi:hypothetical protein
LAFLEIPTAYIFKEQVKTEAIDASKHGDHLLDYIILEGHRPSGTSSKEQVSPAVSDYGAQRPIN